MIIFSEKIWVHVNIIQLQSIKKIPRLLLLFLFLFTDHTASRFPMSGHVRSYKVQIATPIFSWKYSTYDSFTANDWWINLDKRQISKVKTQKTWQVTSNRNLCADEGLFLFLTKNDLFLFNDLFKIRNILSCNSRKRWPRAIIYYQQISTCEYSFKCFSFNSHN